MSKVRKISDGKRSSGKSLLGKSIIPLIAAGMVFAAFQPSAAYREVPLEQRDAFKVCADPHNMPNSNDKREGFEDKIAELFADALGMELEFYYFPQRMAFIRNSLRKQIDIGVYACDVVMSVPEDFGEATPTIPYYKSQYVIVFKDSWKHSDKVEKPEDIVNLSEDEREGMMIGMTDGSTGNVWVVRNGLRSHATSYRRMMGDARVSIGDVYLKDLLEGKITHAIVWGPIAGYWMTHEAPDAGLRMLPLFNHPKDARQRFEYTFSMGVRHGDYYMRSALDDLIDTHQDEINEILESYGVPLLPLR
jgi:mxaJ protein